MTSVRTGGYMATPLGKFLRKVRIDRDQVLYNMAEELEVSSAQLSAIELGKRSIAEKLKQRLITLYSQFASGEEEVARLVDVSQPTYKENLADTSEIKRELFISFARSYKDLSEEEAKKWLDELNEMTTGK